MRGRFRLPRDDALNPARAPTDAPLPQGDGASLFHVLAPEARPCHRGGGSGLTYPLAVRSPMSTATPVALEPPTAPHVAPYPSVEEMRRVRDELAPKGLFPFWDDDGHLMTFKAFEGQDPRLFEPMISEDGKCGGWEPASAVPKRT